MGNSSAVATVAGEAEATECAVAGGAALPPSTLPAAPVGGMGKACAVGAATAQAGNGVGGKRPTESSTAQHKWCSTLPRLCACAYGKETAEGRHTAHRGGSQYQSWSD